MTETNRAFNEMRSAARDMMAGKDPAAMAEKAGVVYSGGEFIVPSLGKEYRISYPDCTISPDLSGWQPLVMLHYLNLADGTPVSGVPCSMGDLPDGVVRGTKFAATSAKELTAFLLDKDEEDVRRRCLSLGGSFTESKADLSVIFPFLPRFPVYLNIWFADDEFPPSAAILMDSSAGHYLSIEDTVAVAEVVIEALMNA